MLKPGSGLARIVPALLLLAAPAAAIDVGSFPPQGYVSDYARVVDARHKQELETYCARVEAASGVQIALVTFPSLQGEDIERWANDWYRKWGVGSKKNDEGILVLVVPNDRKIRIEVGYGLEPIVPDAMAGQFVRRMGPALKDGQYGAAFAEAAHAIGERIAQAKNIKIGESLPRRRPRQTNDQIPFPLLAGLAVLALLMFLGRGSGGGRGGRYRRSGTAGDILTGAVIGGLLGRGSGSRGGGGFGGYDSGGGFGGFGGGDSGGGGASGSW